MIRSAENDTGSAEHGTDSAPPKLIQVQPAAERDEGSLRAAASGQRLTASVGSAKKMTRIQPPPEMIRVQLTVERDRFLLWSLASIGSAPPDY